MADSSQIVGCSNWATLPKDLLKIISGKLTSVLDYVRFSAVCPGWRSSVRPIKFTLLMLPSDLNSDTMSFYNIFDKRVENIQLPEAYNKVICGSSYGWLFLMDEFGSTSLFNPFTKNQIQLPPVTEELAMASGLDVSRVGERYVLHSEDRLTTTPINLMQMQQTFIKKALLTSDPGSSHTTCIVMAILANSKKIAFCRPDDENWMLLDTDLPSSVESMVYCNRRFYVVDSKGRMSVCVAGPPTRAVRFGILCLPICHPQDTFYLLEYNKALLLVVLCRNSDTEPFKVYRADIWRRPWWSEVESPSDIMIFLSPICNFCIPVGDHSQYKGCIYLSDAERFNSGHREAEAHRIMIMDLKNGSSELVECSGCSSSKEVFWVTPNFSFGTICLGM